MQRNTLKLVPEMDTRPVVIGQSLPIIMTRCMLVVDTIPILFQPRHIFQQKTTSLLLLLQFHLHQPIFSQS